MRHGLRRGFFELTALVVLTVISSFTLQMLRAEPLPYRLPPEAWTLESKAVWVSPSKALTLYNKGEVLFVDIREEDAFLEGHIPGALNLPIFSLNDLYDAFIPWAQDQDLLVYGSIEDASGLDEALLELEDLGHTPLITLPHGWEEWVKIGGEIETGADGVLETGWEDDWENELEGES